MPQRDVQVIKATGIGIPMPRFKHQPDQPGPIDSWNNGVEFSGSIPGPPDAVESAGGSTTTGDAVEVSIRADINIRDIERSTLDERLDGPLPPCAILLEMDGKVAL